MKDPFKRPPYEIRKKKCWGCNYKQECMLECFYWDKGETSPDKWVCRNCAEYCLPKVAAKLATDVLAARWQLARSARVVWAKPTKKSAGGKGATPYTRRSR